jgi:hypothetical protein
VFSIASYLLTFAEAAGQVTPDIFAQITPHVAHQAFNDPQKQPPKPRRQMQAKPNHVGSNS